MSETAIKGSFKTEGFKELNDLLLGLPDEIDAEKLLRSALFEAALVIREEAQRRAPVVTGTLRMSIGRKIGRANLESILSGDRYAAICLVGIVSKSKERLKKEGRDVNAFYGMFVEKGTRKMKPEPFLGPAFDTRKEDFTAVLKDKLTDGIDNAVRKYGGTV